MPFFSAALAARISPLAYWRPQIPIGDNTKGMFISSPIMILLRFRLDIFLATRCRKLILLKSFSFRLYVLDVHEPVSAYSKNIFGTRFLASLYKSLISNILI